MAYQTYQVDEVKDMLTNNNTIEVKILNALLMTGITSVSVQKLLGNNDTGADDFWKDEYEGVTPFVSTPLESWSKLYISKDSAIAQGYVINKIGIGIPKASQREDIHNRISLNETFVEFIYNARLFGKIESVDLSNPINPAFTYSTPAKDGTDKVVNHSLQFIDSRSLLESNGKLENINPDIKTVIVSRSTEMLNDVFQLPLLMEFSEELVESGYNFGLGIDGVENYYFLSSDGISLVDSLTLMSPLYANRFIKSNKLPKYESVVDLMDSDGYSRARLQAYGINIELGMVQLADDNMAKTIMNDISRSVLQKGIYVSKSLKSSFQTYSKEMFDIDELIKSNTYEELNEVSSRMNYANYINMLSDMALEGAEQQ